MYEVHTFRSRQYQLIPQIIESCVDYIKTNKPGYNKISLHRITNKEIIDYESVNYSKLSKLQVEVKDQDGNNKTLFSTIIPQLIDNNYFILNETLYAPAIYIEEPPIYARKRSLTVYSLINTITFYKNRAIFANINFLDTHFLKVFVDDSVIQNYKAITDSTTPIPQINEAIRSVASSLNIDDNLEVVRNKINNLFFDSYTKKLYANWYNIDESNLNLQYILSNITNYITFDKYAFIDLQRKRAVFIERYLQPIFNAVRKFVANGQNIELKQTDILSYFRQVLNSKFICDNLNCYTNMHIYKVQMVSPNIERPPSIISYIHPSFQGRVCPVNTLKNEPGKVVYLTPTTQIDDFGRIL